MKENISVDPEEIAHFSQMAEEWWDEEGKFKPLHQMGMARIQYLRNQIIQHFRKDHYQLQALEGLSLIDIGCGGGLVAEPMARLGAHVTGVDAAEKNIKIAALHAEQSGLSIDYQCTTAEAMVEQKRQYDVVLALEIVEHVANVEAFIASCAALVKPGGLLIMSTLNRTIKSYAFAIIGAEYVLRWLPRGTHHWKKFLRPSELYGFLTPCGLEVKEMTGVVLNPLTGRWELNPRDLDVNYMLTATKA